MRIRIVGASPTSEAGVIKEKPIIRWAFLLSLGKIQSRIIDKIKNPVPTNFSASIQGFKVILELRTGRDSNPRPRA